MRYGVTLQGRDDPTTFAETAAWIESLGFDNLWITDSSLANADVYVYMTLALQATSRLTVGAAVTNPLTRHPAITANVFRSLEQLAPGRVICGIGVGDRPLHPLGLPFAKLQTLADSIEAIRRLWRGERVTGQAGRWRFEEAHLRSPVPELPVYIAFDWGYQGGSDVLLTLVSKPVILKFLMVTLLLKVKFIPLDSAPGNP